MDRCRDRPHVAALAMVVLTMLASSCMIRPIVPHPADQVCPAGAARWSDPGTWPGGLPAAGDSPVIAGDRTVALDVDTPPLGGLTIEGTLVVCRRDTQVTADWIMVHGALQAGTPEVPFTHDLTFTLTGDDPTVTNMGMGTRGILVMGGQLRLFGDAPDVEWTRVGADVAAGATNVVLDQPVDWEVGDQIAVTITDWYGTADTEVRTVTSVSGSTVGVDQPITAARWGRLQHVTSTGMGLAPDPTVVPTASPTPLVLDERAEVANLTRNIVIEAPDDDLWQDEGFGVHVMAMNATAQLQIDGVEVRRGGQRGLLGRYPFHWHRMSYGADGSTLADITDNWIRSSVVHESANRCITIHATNGAVVEDDVCLDIVGHGVFLEDAVERRNTITGNLIARVRNPAPADALKVHEITFDQGSSGMWLSNPDNTVLDNVVSDAQGPGYWLAFPRQPVGLSANVPMHPDRIRFGRFEGNTAHSNGKHGMMLDFAETDDAGNVFPNQYYSTSDGQDPSWPNDTLERFSITRFTTWKNQFGGFWNRVTWPDYTEFVSADNEDRYFAGAGADGSIRRSLVVGTSLNSATPRPHPTLVPTAFASYHSSFDMRDNVVVGFPSYPGVRSGTFATDDYYIRAVDKGHIRNPGNLLIGSDPGTRVPRPSPNYALAGALWDPHGTWGPDGRYVVYDQPFLTHGATCDPVLPAGSAAASCEGPYYGVDSFVLDQGNERYDARFPIDVTRDDGAGGTVGQWTVGDGNLISAFQNMRHFAARPGARYLLDFPGSAVPSDVGLTVENAPSLTDSFVLGIRFDGSEPANVYASTVYNYFDPGHAASAPSAVKHDYAPAASLAAVIASPGETYWQDVANDVVWVKVRGGLTQAWIPPDAGPYDDETLYQAFNLRVW